MSRKLNDNLKEGFDRLKRALKKAFVPKGGNPIPQLILQPYKNKQRFGKD